MGLTRREITQLKIGTVVMLMNGEKYTITDLKRYNGRTFQKWNNIEKIMSNNTELDVKDIKYIYS